MTSSSNYDSKVLLEEKIKDFEKLKEEYQEFKEQSAELESFLENENTEKDKTILIMTKKIDQNEKNLDNINIKQEASRKEIIILSKNIENLKKELEESQRAQQEFKRKSIDLEQVNEDLTNKLRSIETQFEELEEKFIQIQEEFVILKEDRDELENTKNEEIILLKEEIKEINEEYRTKLLNSKEKLASTSSSAEKNQLSTKVSPPFEQKESISNYVDLRNKYICEIDQLKDELEALKEEHQIWVSKTNKNSGYNIESIQIPSSIDNPAEKILLKEKENLRKSRISSFFSKGALEKIVQDIQKSDLMKKKSSFLGSEKAIVDFKRTNDQLIQENKKLTEVVEKVKSETIRNKEFIINNIRELEKRHRVELEKILSEQQSKYQSLQSKFQKLEKDYAKQQKKNISFQNIGSPMNSAVLSERFGTTRTLKSENELFSNQQSTKNDRYKVFLYIKNPKSSKSFACPYIDLKNDDTIMVARVTQNGLDRNIINKNLISGSLISFDTIFLSLKKMEDQIQELVQINKKNKAFVIYGPKKTNKKNIQMFILENLVCNIKLYLRNLDCSKCEENETYTLTLKYDSYTNDKKRKTKPYTLNLDYILSQHENVLKQFELIFEELKKNFFTKTLEKEENSYMVRVFEVFLTNNHDNDKNLSFLVISSNKIKSNLKKLEVLSTNVEEILRFNDLEKNFNTISLQIYEKFLFISVSPNLENFKLTYDTLSFANSKQRLTENKSKPKNLEVDGNQDSLAKMKNISLEHNIMKEKISKKNKEIIELRRIGRDLEIEKINMDKKMMVLENNNENLRVSLKKVLLNIKKISNDSVHKQSRKRLMRVPTNTKLERQTNFIQKLIDHNEYFHFLKTSADTEQLFDSNEKNDNKKFFYDQKQITPTYTKTEKNYESETKYELEKINDLTTNNQSNFNKKNENHKRISDLKIQTNCLKKDENELFVDEDDDVL